MYSGYTRLKPDTKVMKNFNHLVQCFSIFFTKPNVTRAGATFDWLFFDNSKLIDFDD